MTKEERVIAMSNPTDFTVTMETGPSVATVRRVMRGPRLMACQYPSDDGPKPIRCLAMAKQGARFCAGCQKKVNALLRRARP